MKSKILAAYAASVSSVNARYPYRLPDWLWDTASNSHLLSSEEILILRNDIAKLTELGKLPDSQAADSLEAEIAGTLAKKFGARDLAAGANIVSNPNFGLSLALQVDPSFSPTATATLRNAASCFIEVALEPAVINTAFDRSTSTPNPMPRMFETKDGKQEVDEVGRPVLTEDYAFYLKQRARPFNPQQFRNQLSNAITNANGDPAILLVSSYSGDWWGGGYYGYFSDPIQQLGRESSAGGYIYIKMNSDKFLPSEPGWNDPRFWASKIAHELLHNLGYWHPVYKDPTERDANNQGNSWAFIVSYETAIYERLK